MNMRRLKIPLFASVAARNHPRLARFSVQSAQKNMLITRRAHRTRSTPVFCVFLLLVALFAGPVLDGGAGLCRAAGAPPPLTPSKVPASVPASVVVPAGSDAAAALPAVPPDKKVRVGYTNNYGIVQGSDGRLTGFGVEYLQEVARHTGWVYEFVPGTWQENIHRLRRGEIDMLGPMQRTPERSKDFLFSEAPMGYEYGVLVARKDNDELYYDDFATFNGMNVGVAEGNYYNAVFEKFRRKNGFQVAYTSYKNATAMMQSLKNGDVDMVVTSTLYDAPHSKLVGRFGAEPFYLALHPSQRARLDELNQAIVTIRTENMFFDVQLYSRHFRGAHTGLPAFSRAEEEYVQSHRRLRVAFVPDVPPVETVDDQGKFQGISAEIIRLMAEYGGLHLESVRMQSHAEALRAVLRGDVDILSGYVDTSGYSTQPLPHTEPYLQVPLVLVAHGGAGRQEKMRIAVPRRYGSLLDTVREDYPEAEVVGMGDTQDCLGAVHTGQADIALISSYRYDISMGTRAFEGMRLVSVTHYMVEMSVGISPALPHMVPALLNKALARVTPNDVQNIIRANTAHKPEAANLVMLLHLYALQAGFFVAALGVGAAALWAWRRRGKQAALWRLAYEDRLTGYAHWNKFEAEAETAPWRGRHACVVLDIDGFKEFNQYYGYEEGTRVLRLAARTLHEALQPGESFARRSGDKFVLRLNVNGEAALRERLQELLLSLSRLPAQSGEDSWGLLALACGVYVPTEQDMRFGLIYERANRARKSLKPLRENAVAFFDQAMQERRAEEADLEKRREEALNNNEFRLVLEPVFALSTGTLVGGRARLMWKHPQRGDLHWSRFVPLFLKTNFILKLDTFILIQACRLLRQWLDKGLQPVPVSVPVSRSHMQRSAMKRNVRDVLDLYGIPPRLVELEVMETALSGEHAEKETMRGLDDMGCTLAMGASGKGSISLALLQGLPLRVVKLGSRFLAFATPCQRGRQVMNGFLGVLKQLGVRSVAVDVETQEQADCLRDAGCEQAQGPYFCPPLSVEEFERRYLK